MGSRKEKKAKKGYTPAARFRRRIAKSFNWMICDWCQKRLKNTYVFTAGKRYCDKKCQKEDETWTRSKDKTISSPPPPKGGSGT